MNKARKTLSFEAQSLAKGGLGIRVLRVMLNGVRVGTLAQTPDNVVAFEYSDSWLSDGFSISPLSLPLQQQVYLPNYLPFDGLWGVFSDSLPDGWGRLLVDRVLSANGISPDSYTALSRLAIVGRDGMGALSYEPEFVMPSTSYGFDLDALAANCRNILNSEYTEDLDEIFALGGSSGGARPKILTVVDGEEWIIKFSSSIDSLDAGKMEFDYSVAAKECGVDMAECRLFPSKIHEGYFGTRRFDRATAQQNADKNGDTLGSFRLHMASVSALLETSHRIPSLDYSLLMRLCLKLTDSYKDLESLYRLMCFNVFAHNRDDHAENFSFLMTMDNKSWQFAPAYDLTFNRGMGGEHATTVNGKGRDIAIEDLLVVGVGAGLSRKQCQSIAEDIQEKTSIMLARYLCP